MNNSEPPIQAGQVSSGYKPKKQSQKDVLELMQEEQRLRQIVKKGEVNV